MSEVLPAFRTEESKRANSTVPSKLLLRSGFLANTTLVREGLIQAHPLDDRRRSLLAAEPGLLTRERRLKPDGVD